MAESRVEIDPSPESEFGPGGVRKSQLGTSAPTVRVSEVALPGHPDKLCDQIADAVVAECLQVDADAYAQVEVGIGDGHVWLSGALCTRRKLLRSLDEVAREVIRSVGYRDLAQRIQSQSVVREQVGDPRSWSTSVNDQTVVIGWAGYDAKTCWLPPEHFLAHSLREAITNSFRNGLLEGQSPDGKLLVCIREDDDGWHFEHLLATVHERDAASLLKFRNAVTNVSREAYERLQQADRRWRARWKEVEVLVNPIRGLNGDSEMGIGQTGRKLVMDHYGPRVPIGGSALSGKHLAHIDRIGAYAAREAAINAVTTGASECLVRVCWAPSTPAPIDVTYQMVGLGKRKGAEWFDHRAMTQRYRSQLDYLRLAQGTHFFDDAQWNRRNGSVDRSPQDAEIPGTGTVSKDKARDLWAKASARLRERLSRHTFQKYFEPIRPLSLDGTQLVLAHSSKFMIDWICDNLMRRAPSGSRVASWVSHRREPRVARLDRQRDAVQRPGPIGNAQFNVAAHLQS